ncbi:hypothetical protein BDE36_3338 [Arcticibacter tournemirensis]|uniref:Transcriptional regulator, AbiEi antitoxin, Type IV TA system n=1 Tax=Arcticibacter tournemirensis TaxID=699437 RepID=A0A5M9H1K2_9SPHI|nr:hypothetical protein [Arcticibacter tournemirensis]KAA8479975.1 hypothetical protein F1649_16230 [Arcticibacter tournemirensis]TQM51559.1 hypothetical protein BDE36_3338 [Arcticibacter tournemirensis]
MDLSPAVRSYMTHPLTRQLILSLLKDYRRPNDKVHELLKQGILQSIKKGLYIAGPSFKGTKPEPFLLANHISGPSYVSLDSALSYHGLIPERVFEISSMTTKASCKFTTPAGIFTYTHLDLPYYAFGIQQTKLSDEQHVMLASPEKALFDKVATTAGIILRSTKSAAAYLIEDLRMDEDILRGLNTRMMSSWLPDAPKKDSLSMAIKMIEKL